MFGFEGGAKARAHSQLQSLHAFQHLEITWHSIAPQRHECDFEAARLAVLLPNMSSCQAAACCQLAGWQPPHPGPPPPHLSALLKSSRMTAW